MDVYRVDVSDILDDLGASVEASDDLSLDPIEVGAERFVPTEAPHFDVTVTNTGTALVAMGTIIAPVTATCARCLCEFPTVIEADVEGFYIRRGDEESVPEEQEVEYVGDDEMVDLMPALHAALVLEAPFAPVHDEECKGLCPDCGADLNEGPCGCERQNEPHGPFAALRDLDLGKDENTD